MSRIFELSKNLSYGAVEDRIKAAGLLSEVAAEEQQEAMRVLRRAQLDSPHSAVAAAIRNALKLLAEKVVAEQVPEINSERRANSSTSSRRSSPKVDEPPRVSSVPLAPAADFDVFICHASEDKAAFVEPLAKRLAARNIRVWYDSFTLRLGDRLRAAIDEGLARSRFGVVVLSPSFCRKDWPQRELEGLLALERGGRKVILPLWHRVTHADVTRFSPMLADRVALTSDMPLEEIVEEIVDVIRPAPRRSTRLRELSGEYVVTGYNPSGREYRGRAAIREHEGILVIAASIGTRTYVCQGPLVGDKLTVYGDYDVEYTVNEDGSLIGTWGNGGHEVLTPTELMSGPKEPPTPISGLRPKGDEDSM